jgi:hypothetical protein
LDSRDWNERFRIINLNIRPNDDIDHIFDNGLNYDLDEMEPIGDHFLSAAMPYDAPIDLKRNIIAVLKAYSLGLSSVDYVIKKYGSLWEFPLPSEDQKEFHRLLRRIKNEIIFVIKLFNYVTTRPNYLGLRYAEATLIRLKGSFRSTTLLISNGYPLEALSICRLILEQISWAYCIHNFTDAEKIKNMKPHKTISFLKRLLGDVGKLYGWLNIITHVDPAYNHQYAGLSADDNVIIKYNIPELTNIVLHCLLRLTDIFRIVSEYIFGQFMEKMQAWEKDEKGNLILCENRPLSEEIKKLTQKLVKQS